MNAVIYCRVSSEEQVANLSLGTQEKACREACDRNGWEVGRVFIERGESAKTADRTELQAALEHCRKARSAVGVFVVYAVDRFARQQQDHHALRGVLGRLGIPLRSATQPLDDTPEGHFIEGVLAASAQYDNDVRARNTRRGMRAALETGRWCWQPPLGYRPSYDPSSGRHLGIEPHPDVAPLIARAFRSIAFGARVTDVVAELQEQGILGARGTKVAETTLQRVLRNPLYRGRIVVARWAIDREGSHEPLVDAATWARVQRQLDPSPSTDRQARPYRRANPDFALGGGFARCELCSGPLTGAWAQGRSARYPYYRCYRCDRVGVRRERLHGDFLDLLCRLQPPPAAWATFREVVLEEYELATGDRVARVGRARARLEAAQGRRTRLVDAYVYDRALSLADYRERLAALEREATEAELEIATAEAGSGSLEGLLNFAERTLARPAELWLELAHDPPLRRVAAVAICPHGITHDGRQIATAVTHSLYSALGSDAGIIPRVVPPTGQGLHRPPVDLATLVGDLIASQGALSAL